MNDPGSYGSGIFYRKTKNLLNVRDKLSSAKLPRGSSSTRDLKIKLNLEVSGGNHSIFRCLQESGYLKFVKR